MTYEVIPFDPGSHAVKAHCYEQNTVVDGAVPLGEIDFPPGEDDISQYVGRRNATDCPDLENLSAQSGQPLIGGAEQKQHLTVPCSERRQITFTGSTTAYPVCMKRLSAQGLKLHKLLPSQCTSPNAYAKISCPFMYLGGLVNGEVGTVRIAVDARNPEEPSLYYSQY